MKKLSPRLRFLLTGTAGVLLVACLVFLVYTLVRGRSASEEDTPSAEEGLLDGSWRGLRYTGDCSLSVSGHRFRFIGPTHAEGTYRLTWDRLSSGRSSRLTFEGGGPYEYLIYHEQEYAGETLRLLSCVLMEYDGRGEVITEEYIFSPQYRLVPPNFVSELAERMNGQP